MSKKIILTVMTLANVLGGILGTCDKASATKKSTNKKSIDVIVGYKDYIRKVKTNGKITKLKYDKNYLKLTKKGNKIKFSEAFKAGKTTVTVKCKGCKASKITVKIWKNEEAWGYEFSKRWASNKKIISKYLNNISLHDKYNKRVRKFNKCKNLIIKNYDVKEIAAAKKAAGKYIKVKFYKGDIDICCSNVVLLSNKKSDKDYTRRIYNAISYNNYSTTCEETRFYRGLKNTLPGVKIISCIGMGRGYSNIYNSPDIDIIFKDTNNDEYNTDFDIDTETDDTDSNVDNDNIDDTNSNVDTNEAGDETTNNIPTTTTETTVEEDGTTTTTTTTTGIIVK